MFLRKKWLLLIGGLIIWSFVFSGLIYLEIIPNPYQIVHELMNPLPVGIPQSLDAS